VRRTSYAAAVDKVLRPMGFEQNGRDWTRQIGSVLEGVSLQKSQIAGTTANLWSKDLATEALLKEAMPWLEPPIMVIFSWRIGQLMSGLDCWWKNDSNGPTELSEALQKHVPEFFNGRRSLEAQALSFGRLSPKWSGSRINLAMTLYRLGDAEEACRILENPPKTTPDVWKRKAESVRNWILRSQAKAISAGD
jgi:hypothetical protein